MSPATAWDSWVDQANYFGPNRRMKGALFRFRERRKEDQSGPIPSLSKAVRRLKLGVLDAQGERGVMEFAQLALNVATLAELHEETEVSEHLRLLARRLYACKAEDVRPFIYASIDKLHLIPSQIH